jgi:hypothetical protein
MQLLDIAPTILQRFAVPVPASMRGQIITGRTDRREHVVGEEIYR